ncbi:MAG: DUF169 domain-containing protein [Anaerolineae bacterium]|jgi:uncharacterized protein (DUF169 family)
MSTFQEIAEEVREFLDMPHDPVGVAILEGAQRDDPPTSHHRFCILEREDLAGAEHTFRFGDLECPGGALALGMTPPRYVEVEPRIHRSVAAVRVGPLEEADVVLFTITPRQAMVLALLVGGIEGHCTGGHAICGEVIARIHETDRPHLSLLCPGVRELCGFQDEELVVGIPWRCFTTLPHAMARRPFLR